MAMAAAARHGDMDQARERMGADAMIEAGQTFTFTSPYDQYAARVGQAATVLGEVDRSTFDYAEVGPLYRVRFGDGTEIEAWPEEIDPAKRTER